MCRINTGKYVYSTRLYVVTSQHNKVQQLFRKQTDVIKPVSALPPTLTPSHPAIRFASRYHRTPLPMPCLYTQTQQVGFTRKRAQRARPCCKSKLGNVALDIDRFNHYVAVKFLVIYPYNVLFLYNKLCSVLDKLLNKVTKLQFVMYKYDVLLSINNIIVPTISM